MATYDLIGVPFPINHPLFFCDTALLNKIKKVEGLIELSHDFDNIESALTVLHGSLEKEKHELFLNEFGLDGRLIPDMVLSYIVVLYAKSFTKSTGRTQLNDKIESIFGDNTSSHQFVMDLRHYFYAHHGLEANRHQIFCHKNKPNEGDIKLDPGSQRSQIIMSGSIDLSVIEQCVTAVKMYLINQIDNLCHNIEASLSTEQKDVINNVPKEELFKDNWKESQDKRVSPFKIRNT